MFTIGTFIKDSLTFINRSKLYRVKSNFRMATANTGFCNGCTNRIVRLAQSGLFFITFRPNRCWSLHGIGCDTWQHRHLGQIRSIVANVTFNISRGVHGQRRSAVGTKGPPHVGYIQFLYRLISGRVKLLTEFRKSRFRTTLNPSAVESYESMLLRHGPPHADRYGLNNGVLALCYRFLEFRQPTLLRNRKKGTCIV